MASEIALHDEEHDDFSYPRSRTTHLALVKGAPRAPLRAANVRAASAGSERAIWQDLAANVTREARRTENAEVRYFLARAGEQEWSVTVGKRKRSGEQLGPLLPVTQAQSLDALETDRELLRLLKALSQYACYGGAAYQATVSAEALPTLLPRLAQSGRCHLVSPAAAGEGHLAWDALSSEPSRAQAVKSGDFSYDALLELPVLATDGAGLWALELTLTEALTRGRGGATDYEARGALVRGGERRALDEVALARDGSLLFEHGLVGACGADDARWLQSLRELQQGVLVPEAQLEGFLELALGTGGVSQLALPKGFEQAVVTEPPRLLLELDAPRGRLTFGRVFFEYGEQRVSACQQSPFAMASKRRLLRRDSALETAALAQLRAAGFDGLALGGHSPAGSDVGIANEALAQAIQALLAQGWVVFAEGKRFRALSKFDIRVNSGLDWFEVEGVAQFSDVKVPLPELLRRMQRSSGIVELGDGSRGILPADWLERWGAFAELRPKRDQRLRFSSRQLGVAEAALGALGDDENVPGLSELRRRIDRFCEVTPQAPPPGFLGTLRPYQAHGLGWLASLSKLEVGMCLADDMGLGKTIQVLAHLASAHQRSDGRRSAERAPSLVVVPRSLLENWLAEARRFAPKLCIYAHWGPERGELRQAIRGVDVVLTTYGMLRLERVAFSKIEFSTVVLDEAQAIKNEKSATAKCAKRLRATHRIALSGTPIENHLGELWSLFEFLNPGMLAELPGLQRALRAGQTRPETLQLIQRVLRPFVLRRTKREVAKDLPERSEQTLFVDLEKDERTHYDELLRYYQASIRKRGLAQASRSTPHVLEALLRLRQAACHSGLVDKARAHERSSKVELLVEKLRSVVREGHKALVFSQFTSLLAIVRERLAEERIAFEYLDGGTQDRAARVSRFQSTPELSVFLISLKAGGVGLNLTAADYVFILDPWWNPAAEAQAIDRAHRIGQKRNVIAYRLLTRNTVEERVAELQGQKRKLVSAVMDGESAFAGRLTRGDLESLLGMAEA